MLDSCFYFLFGVATTVYVLLLFQRLFKPASNLDNKTEENHAGAKFYLNLFILNHKEVVETIVKTKISRKTPLLRAIAKRLAVKLVTDEKLLEKIGAEFCKLIPERLENSAGIKCTVNIAYAQSAFMCFEVSLVEVNLKKLIEIRAGEVAGAKIEHFLSFITFPPCLEFLNNLLVNLLYRKIMAQIPPIVKEKLQNRMNAEIEVFSLTEEEQGPFIMQTIHHLNNASEIPVATTSNDEK
eukprot:gene4632-6511_t